jgi:hypothetical protein
LELLGTGKQRAMKAAQITVGGTALTFASWEIVLNIDDYSTVNFESWDDAEQESFDEGISGIFGCDIKFGGDWDAGTNFFDDPPGLFPRDDLADVEFVENVDDAVQWTFPFIRLRSSTNGGDIHNKVAFNCSGKNQGIFELPTGSV